jgi:hypothetical protein
MDVHMEIPRIFIGSVLPTSKSGCRPAFKGKTRVAVRQMLVGL